MRICSVVLVVVFAFAVAHKANAGKFFYDDFEDGSATDGRPVTWAPLNITSSDGGGQREVVDGSFIHMPRGLDTFLDEVNTEVAGQIYEDVSLHTRVLAGPGNQVGVFARNTFVNGTDRKEFQLFGDFLANGALRIGYARVDSNGELFGDILQFAQTGWTPSAQDINLKFDVIGDTASLTGWLEGDTQPKQPQVSVNIGSLTDGDSNKVERGTVGVFVIPTDPDLPAPEPVAFRHFAAVHKGVEATFTPLGDLPGGSFESYASGVSADGSVVVGESRSASGFEAFRWTRADGMIGLGDLPGGIYESEANDISADGSVIVGFSSSASGEEAFRWTSNGGMVRLGDLPGGLFQSDAHGVSADGAIVVGIGNSASGLEAFRWTAGGGMVGLGDLPGGIFQSTGEGISANGSVIVGVGNLDLESFLGVEAYRWTTGGGMVGLGDLPGGTFASAAYRVSADGSVVVGEGRSASGSEGFRWTASGGMVGLGDLPGGPFESIAWDVSADGSVVVGVGNLDLESFLGEAFRWTSDDGMQNLRELLIASGATELTGWTLTHAQAVSADGHTIVGWGINPLGQSEAWLARLDFDPQLAGDFNDDGIVDAADYVVWRKGLGTTHTQNDYDTWRANFGKTVGSGAALPSAEPVPAIPEPSTALVVFVGSLALAARCRPTHVRHRRASVTFASNPCRRSLNNGVLSDYAIAGGSKVTKR
jgi:probable HAF family extracellular repeat protein